MVLLSASVHPFQSRVIDDESGSQERAEDKTGAPPLEDGAEGVEEEFLEVGEGGGVHRVACCVFRLPIVGDLEGGVAASGDVEGGEDGGEEAGDEGGGEDGYEGDRAEGAELGKKLGGRVGKGDHLRANSTMPRMRAKAKNTKIEMMIAMSPKESSRVRWAWLPEERVMLEM